MVERRRWSKVKEKRELCGEALRGEYGKSRKKGEKKKVEGRGRRKSRKN